MEQNIFSAIGIDWKLLLAQVINFLILFFILKKFLFAPAVKILTERRKRIEESIKQTVLIQKESEELEIKKAEVTAKAKKEAQEILAETQKNAKDLQKEMLASTENEMRLIQEKATKEISAEKQKILSEAKQELASIAILAAEKVIEKNLDVEEEKMAVQKTLKDLENENFA